MVLSIGIERSSGLKASPLWGRRNFVFSKTSWHSYALQDIFCFLFLVVFIIIIKDTVLVPLSEFSEFSEEQNVFAVHYTEYCRHKNSPEVN